MNFCCDQGVCLAVLAAGGAAGEVRDQAHKAEIDSSFGVHDRLGQRAEALNHFWPPLHGQQTVGDETKDSFEDGEIFGQLRTGFGG